MSFIFHRKNTSTKRRSKFSEQRAAAVFGGKVQPASGAINRFDLKADIKSAEYLVDDKTTGRNSYGITIDLWRKLSKEAWMNKRKPMMRIEFTKGPTLYVMDEITFMKLQRKSNDQK